ncbi:MAG: methylglyoxal synthase [Lactovum sp.]
MKIGLVAHDNKKKEMAQFIYAYKMYLEKHEIFATGLTGELVHEKVGIDITIFQPGSLGGNQEMGAMISKNELDMLLFFRDPINKKTNESDHSELLRLCDFQKIPVATNMASAEIFVLGLHKGNVGWREIVQKNREQEIIKKELLKGLNNITNIL